MFRWCAYCQRLIGEREPLARYEVTHGICPRCEKNVDTYVSQRSTLVARDLFSELTRIGTSGDLSQCDRFVRSALGAGLRPSEILIGLLHPALGQIGERWERGEIGIRDEHQFTAFAARVLELVPIPDSKPTGAGSIVLAMPEGNQHDLGIRMLQRVALERGHACVAFHPGLPDGEIVRIANDLRPSVLGLSVSMREAIPGALRLCERLWQEADAGTHVVLGGNAFRHDRHPVSLPARTPVLRSIDDFVLAIEEL